MGRLDDLSPEQRAVVQLLLQRGKGYDELATLLRTDAAAVRQRAEGALVALGRAAGATEPPEAQRAVLADWLLGQQDAETAQATATLAAGEPARTWAAAIADELRPIGGDRVPEVPEPSDDAPIPGFRAEPSDDAPVPGFRPPPPGGGPRASRLGGALLILGLAAVVAIVLILVLGSGSSDNGSSTSASTGTQSTSTTSTTQAQPTIEGQINLRAPGAGKALGVATVIAQGGQRGIVVNAQDLQPNSKRNAYVAWLTGGPSDGVKRLGATPVVGKNGRLENVTALLPEDAKDYRALELSLETSNDPAKPTDVVLRGRL
ncbi:anti-sigma factor domain-containing protein [Capillimicrobium parvum]|uniref:Anti-sigma K factor RskA C-terminal domain-containing protein n=1 Tax=Capillimicrobium parvum TaxID=2884022 RepID=A0A9E6XXI4_9ACTN|nr:anti-sigma factor [Capillimicrobium parvum]UGS36339.1 hypothetical protein DSM104329_02743 [Capillimicrobium parvum]